MASNESENKAQDVYRGSAAQVANPGPVIEVQQGNAKGTFESNMTLETDTVQTVQSSGKAANAPVIQVVQQQEVEVMENNDVSTVSVPKMSCKEAMSQMQTVLGSYKGEINFTSDEEKLEIGDGLVFIDSFYAVHFKIHTFTDAKTKSTRWEFRRLSGNAMASAKFLGQIKTAFFEDAESAKEDGGAATALEALPLNTDDMKMELSKEQEDRMMVHEALLADEMGIEMDEAAENYLVSKLVEAGAISKDVAVDAGKLVAALMADAVMKHKDVAVQRAAMMMLAKFAKEHGTAMVAGGLVEKLKAASKDTTYPSIKKRADALSKLIAE